MKRPDLIKQPEIFIESMRVLITHYQGALKENISKSDYACNNELSCLLCEPIGSKLTYINLPMELEHKKCCEGIGCPWIVITGMCCDAWSKLNIRDTYGVKEKVYQTTNRKIMNNRIKQLRNWIKIYEKHLNLN